jgi:hypothetical protein
MKSLVTRESLIDIVTRGNEVSKEAVGRALVHLFNRQTIDEQITNDTCKYNDIGFTPQDARSGSITAKYFIKHRTLLDWQYEKWIEPNAKGIPRIAKYWRQLNEVANEKQST